MPVGPPAPRGAVQARDLLESVPPARARGRSAPPGPASRRRRAPRPSPRCSPYGRSAGITTAGRRLAATSAMAPCPACVTTTSASQIAAYGSEVQVPRARPSTVHSQSGVCARASSHAAAPGCPPPSPRSAVTRGGPGRRGPAGRTGKRDTPPTQVSRARVGEARGPGRASRAAGGHAAQSALDTPYPSWCARSPREPGMTSETTRTPCSRASSATSTDTSATSRRGPRRRDPGGQRRRAVAHPLVVERHPVQVPAGGRLPRAPHRGRPPGAAASPRPTARDGAGWTARSPGPGAPRPRRAPGAGGPSPGGGRSSRSCGRHLARRVEPLVARRPSGDSECRSTAWRRTAARSQSRASRIARARSETSPGSASAPAPSVTISGRAPRAYAATGVPQAIASARPVRRARPSWGSRPRRWLAEQLARAAVVEVAGVRDVGSESRGDLRVEVGRGRGWGREHEGHAGLARRVDRLVRRLLRDQAPGPHGGSAARARSARTRCPPRWGWGCWRPRAPRPGR